MNSSSNQSEMQKSGKFHKFAAGARPPIGLLATQINSPRVFPWRILIIVLFLFGLIMYSSGHITKVPPKFEKVECVHMSERMMCIGWPLVCMDVEVCDETRIIDSGVD